METWEVEVQEAEPELFITLPDEVLTSLDLKVGDSLKWDNVYGDGSKIVLTKVEKYTLEEKKVIEQAKSKLREIALLQKQFDEGDFGAGIQLFRAESSTVFYEVAKILMKEIYE